MNYANTIYAEDIASFVAYSVLNVFLTPIWWILAILERGPWSVNVGEDGEGIIGGSVPS